MALSGGPKPFYPRIRPLTEIQKANPTFKPLPLEEDEDWLELVRRGGAGDEAETKEQQEKRYATKNADSPELFPSLHKHVFRPPDLLITCGMDYTIRTFDCHDNYKQVQLFEGHFNFVNCAVPYRGTMILSSSDDCSVRLWQTGKDEYGELLMTYYISRYPVKCVAAVPGQRFCCGSLDQMLRVVSIVTGQVLMRLNDHGKYGPDDNYMQNEGCGSVATLCHIRLNLVATGGDDSTVRFWDIDKGKCLYYEKGHPGYGRDIGDCGIGYKLSEQFAGVWKVINLDDGKRVCSSSYDRTLTIWNVEDASNIKLEKNWRVGDNGVLNIGVVGPVEIASCCGDKEMKIWNWTKDEPELLRTVRTPWGVPQAVGYLDEYKLALCGGDATIRILDWKDGVKDLVGKRGFNAHDFSILDCALLYYADNDEANFTDPIMYCTLAKEEGAEDAQYAIDQHKIVLREALDYVMPGFME